MILSKKCIRGTSGVVTILLIALAISFLVLSFNVSDNATLKMIGEANGPEVHLGKRTQYTFIFISMAIIITASLGISAAYSQDHCISYLFGYFSAIIWVVFACVGISYCILSGRVVEDFQKECASQTGMAYHIDQIYKQGDNMMCTKQCPCNIADKAKFKGWSALPNKKVSKSGYTNFLDCPAETLSKGHQDRYVPLMTALETQFKCAGICELPHSICSVTSTMVNQLSFAKTTLFNTLKKTLAHLLHTLSQPVQLVSQASYSAAAFAIGKRTSFSIAGRNINK